MRQVLIADIQLDPNIWDDILAVLMGLPALWRDENNRMRILEIVNKCGRAKVRPPQWEKIIA